MLIPRRPFFVLRRRVDVWMLFSFVFLGLLFFHGLVLSTPPISCSTDVFFAQVKAVASERGSLLSQATSMHYSLRSWEGLGRFDTVSLAFHPSLRISLRMCHSTLFKEIPYVPDSAKSQSDNTSQLVSNRVIDSQQPWVGTTRSSVIDLTQFPTTKKPHKEAS